MTNPYKFKTKPFAHQVKALRKILSDPAKEVGGSLPMDMGTGKTKVAIDYACIQEQLGNVNRVLIVCPLSVIGVWHRQISQHAPSNGMEWKVQNYERTFAYTVRYRKGERRGTSTRVDHFTELAEYVSGADTLIILDEGHFLRNPNSKRSKALYTLSKMAMRVLNMTGTPIGKSPIDLFGQYRCVDDSILGSNFGAFKSSYGIWGGVGQRQLFKLINQRQLFERVAPYTYACKIEDCVDMPKKGKPQIIPVYLQESKKYYDKMARDALVTIEDDVYSAPHVLTQLMRLHQLTGGWLKAKEHKRRVGHEKERAYTDFIRNMLEDGIEKAVTFVKFTDDIRSVAEACRKVGYSVIPFYGRIPPQQRERFLALFEDTTRPTMFVSQVSVGSMGIDLTCAYYTLYYSLTNDLIHHEQSERRTYRIGQKKPTSFYYFLAQDTVDEAIWLALQTKRNLAQLVHTRPDLIV